MGEDDAVLSRPVPHIREQAHHHSWTPSTEKLRSTTLSLLHLGHKLPLVDVAEKFAESLLAGVVSHAGLLRIDTIKGSVFFLIRILKV